MLRILDRDTSFTVAAWRDVLIMVWREAPRVATILRTGAVLREFAAERGTAISLVQVLEPSSGMPDSASRAAIAREMKRHTPLTRAIAVVFEGRGFLASAMMSLHTTLKTLSRSTTPSKSFNTVLEGATWLTEQIRTASGEAHELADAIEKARGAPHT